MKIVLYPNFKKKNALPTSLKVCSILHEIDVEVFADISFKDDFASVEYVKFGLIDDIVKICDIMIAIGGDGTILQASSYASEYNKPLLGINTGRLGFMASMEID